MRPAGPGMPPSILPGRGPRGGGGGEGGDCSALSFPPSAWERPGQACVTFPGPRPGWRQTWTPGLGTPDIIIINFPPLLRPWSWPECAVGGEARKGCNSGPPLNKKKSPRGACNSGGPSGSRPGRCRETLRRAGGRGAGAGLRRGSGRPPPPPPRAHLWPWGGWPPWGRGRAAGRPGPRPSSLGGSCPPPLHAPDSGWGAAGGGAPLSAREASPEAGAPGPALLRSRRGWNVLSSSRGRFLSAMLEADSCHRLRPAAEERSGRRAGGGGGGRVPKGHTAGPDPRRPPGPPAAAAGCPVVPPPTPSPLRAAGAPPPRPAPGCVTRWRPRGPGRVLGVRGGGGWGGGGRRPRGERPAPWTRAPAAAFPAPGCGGRRGRAGGRPGRGAGLGEELGGGGGRRPGRRPRPSPRASEGRGDSFRVEAVPEAGWGTQREPGSRVTSFSATGISSPARFAPDSASEAFT